MTKISNIQYLLSYAGTIPYLLIFIEKYFFSQIKEDIILNFLIYYSTIILVFIGSLNWNLDKKINFFIVIYGFFPSLFATIIIILNLYKFSHHYLIISIISIFIVQLLFEFFFIYPNKNNKKPLFFLRIPLTFIIVIILVLIIS
tara:strand:- start:87 stop:518 length:432 start_codon:yes stop_codon:yes gene_type:complete